METAAFEAKERLIQEYWSKAADLRRQLESFESGMHWTGEDRVDTTAKDIARLKTEIAEYERCIGAIEKDLRDA